jgi:hypothetical protein
MSTVRLDDQVVARDLERLADALVRMALAWAWSHATEPTVKQSARRSRSRAGAVASVRRASRGSPTA